MPNTTWSSADILTVTLSGTNKLTATGGGNGGVRSQDASLAGAKLYWEYQITTWANAFTAVGLATATASLFNMVGVAGTVMLANTGHVWKDGGDLGAYLGALSNGVAIGVAWDAGLGGVWFRIAPSGNWNGEPFLDPSTGSGEILYPGPLFAAFGPRQSGEIITANFGDSAFVGTPPPGFTAGFPGGAAGAAATALPRAMILA